MIIFRTALSLSKYLQQQSASGKKLGFVPTMGALHDGHLSLIREAMQHSACVVCSIFVNPTQFNNAEDLRHYPVTIESDILALMQTGCHVLFLPSVREVYPEGHIKKHYPLGPVETLLEGAHRPGHFQGVCEVVDRLLDLVSPDQLYLGQKDFQQCLVLARLLELRPDAGNIELQIVSTMREADGLAMSSRNLRLTPPQRQDATAIIRTLEKLREQFSVQASNRLEQEAVSELESAGFVVDYVTIRRRNDLQPLTNNHEPAVALVAATIGQIRLIDNLLLP